MVFFKFLTFFAIFMDFPITGLVGTHRNKFSFPSFSAFPNLFWLEKKRYWCFLIFWIFLLFFFGIFNYGSGTNSSERFFFLFSLFLGFSQLILAGKVAKIVLFSFFNFFYYFLEFSITSRVGTHLNDFFFLSLSRSSPTYFGLERSNNGVL